MGVIILGEINWINIVENYLRVLDTISSLNCELEYKSRVGRKIKIFDWQIFTLSLTAEFMSIDNENTLFKLVDTSQIPNLIERSQFNKRRRKLFLFLEEVKLILNLVFWCLKITLLLIVFP